MGKKLFLTDRQYDLVMSLRKYYKSIWIGVVNKKVVNALIKKGICKINQKDYTVTLTKYGETVEI